MPTRFSWKLHFMTTLNAIRWTLIVIAIHINLENFILYSQLDKEWSTVRRMNLLAVKLSNYWRPKCVVQCCCCFSESLYCQRRESQLSQDKVCESTGVIPWFYMFACISMFMFPDDMDLQCRKLSHLWGRYWKLIQTKDIKAIVCHSKSIRILAKKGWNLDIPGPSWTQLVDIEVFYLLNHMCVHHQDWFGAAVRSGKISWNLEVYS